MNAVKTMCRAGAAAGFLVMTALAPAQADQDAPAAVTEEKVQEIIRDYLLENPEIVIEAIRKYEELQKLAEEQARAEAMIAMRAEIYENPMTPDNGADGSDVTVVEFFDYQCGYCKRLLPAMMAVMEENPSVRFVFKELPILGPASTFAARAALAADRQGKYIPFHNALMDMRGQLTPERVMSTATALGIDLQRLQQDMQDPVIETYLRANLQLAQKLGVTGTPAMLIGDQFVPGAVSKETLVQMIETARAEKG